MNIFDHQIERTATVRRGGLALFFVLLVPLVMAQSPQSTMQDPPKPQDPPHFRLCNFSGPLLHIPSASAGTEGLLVRVSPPGFARYSKGAPIAVHMFPVPFSVGQSFACFSEQGLIDVGFLCPGLEFRDKDGTVWKSGGPAPARTYAG